MLIARVIGEIVVHPEAPQPRRAARCCWFSLCNWMASNRGDALVALDAVDAGVGDLVLLATEGYSAMTSVGRPQLTDRYGGHRCYRPSGAYGRSAVSAEP